MSSAGFQSSNCLRNVRVSGADRHEIPASAMAIAAERAESTMASTFMASTPGAIPEPKYFFFDFFLFLTDSTTFDKMKNRDDSEHAVEARSIASELREKLAFHGHSRGAAVEDDAATV